MCCALSMQLFLHSPRDTLSFLLSSWRLDRCATLPLHAARCPLSEPRPPDCHHWQATCRDLICPVLGQRSEVWNLGFQLRGQRRVHDLSCGAAWCEAPVETTVWMCFQGTRRNGGLGRTGTPPDQKRTSSALARKDLGTSSSMKRRTRYQQQCKIHTH